MDARRRAAATSTGQVAFSISFCACDEIITRPSRSLGPGADDQQVDLALVARQDRVEAVGELARVLDRHVVAGGDQQSRCGRCAARGWPGSWPARSPRRPCRPRSASMPSTAARRARRQCGSPSRTRRCPLPPARRAAQSFARRGAHHDAALDLEVLQPARAALEQRLGLVTPRAPRARASMPWCGARMRGSARRPLRRARGRASARRGRCGCRRTRRLPGLPSAASTSFVAIPACSTAGFHRPSISTSEVPHVWDKIC